MGFIYLVGVLFWIPSVTFSLFQPVRSDVIFSTGLYYDSIQNDIGAERAFLEANRLNISEPKSAEPPGTAGQPAELDEPGTGDEDLSGDAVLDTTVSELAKPPEVHGMLMTEEPVCTSCFVSKP